MFQDKERLTLADGTPVGDKLNSLTAGPRGPILLTDTTLVEELAHFDRERIPERVVHAKGAGELAVCHVDDICIIFANFWQCRILFIFILFLIWFPLVFQVLLDTLR